MKCIIFASFLLGCGGGDLTASSGTLICTFGCSDASVKNDAKSDTSDARPTQDVAEDAGTSPLDSIADAPTRKRIFTSSETYGPNMGGLAGVDAKCQMLADAAKLGGIFKAWLSDSKASAKSRLTHSAVPYELVDGTRVAADWSDLVSGALLHAIDKTEKGLSPPVGVSSVGGQAVWTVTETSGAFYDQSFRGYTNSACYDWTFVGSDAGSAAGFSVGRWNATGAAWTDYTGSLTCSTTTKIAIYCVEQ